MNHPIGCLRFVIYCVKTVLEMMKKKVKNESYFWRTLTEWAADGVCHLLASLIADNYFFAFIIACDIGVIFNSQCIGMCMGQIWIAIERVIFVFKFTTTTTKIGAVYDIWNVNCFGTCKCWYVAAVKLFWPRVFAVQAHCCHGDGQVGTCCHFSVELLRLFTPKIEYFHIEIGARYASQKLAPLQLLRTEIARPTHGNRHSYFIHLIN